MTTWMTPCHFGFSRKPSLKQTRAHRMFRRGYSWRQLWKGGQRKLCGLNILNWPRRRLWNWNCPRQVLFGLLYPTLISHWMWATRRKDVPLRKRLFATEANPESSDIEDCLVTAHKQLHPRIPHFMQTLHVAYLLREALPTVLCKIFPFPAPKHNPSLLSPYPALFPLNILHIYLSGYFLHITHTSHVKYKFHGSLNFV